MTASDGGTGLDRVRRAEYVGENRCLPCTVVNVALAFHLSVALALPAAAVGPPSVAALAGAGVFTLSAVAIYLRGYLVPGTPTLTGQLPDRVLAGFETDERDTEGAAGADGGEEFVD